MMQLWDWDANATAGFDPSKITCRSHKRAHWICHKCPRGQPHRWQATVNCSYRGRGCPFCASKKVCVCNSLKSLHPGTAEEWDYNRNENMLEDYTAKSHVSVWWRNSQRGSFQARIDDCRYVRKPLLPATPPLGMMPALALPFCCLSLSGLPLSRSPSLCPALMLPCPPSVLPCPHAAFLHTIVLTLATNSQSCLVCQAKNKQGLCTPGLRAEAVRTLVPQPGTATPTGAQCVSCLQRLGPNTVTLRVILQC